jgi:hypothetical protein
MRPLTASLAVFATAAALLLVPVSAQAVDGPSWSVGPVNDAAGAARANFSYEVDPGSVLQDSIVVSNDGSADLTLDVYPADAFTTREGNIDVLTSGEPSVDGGSWVAVSATEIILVPGQEVVVPFTVTVPADARPGDHPAGIVTSLRSDDPAAQVQLDRRLGSRMQIRVSGDLVPALEISAPQVTFDGEWNPFASGSVTVDYTLTNTGNTRVTAATAVAMSGPLGIAGVSTASRQLPEVLPGSTIDVSETLDGIAALGWLSGTVTVLPSSVGFGATAMEPVIPVIEMAAIPYATLLILALVLAVVVTAVLIVRSRRSAAAVQGSVKVGPAHAVGGSIHEHQT